MKKADNTYEVLLISQLDKRLLGDNLANFIETKEFNDIVKEQIEIERKVYIYIYKEEKEITKLKNLKIRKIF